MSHARPLLPGALGTADAVAPLRRFPASPRKRPSRLFPWLARAIWPLLLVGLPLLGLGWLLHSPRFALERVEVTPAGQGPGRVQASWIRSSLSGLVGQNLLRLSLSEVEAQLRTDPWVAGVTMVKELPNHLLITVEERRPAARVSWGEEQWWVDGEGRTIARLEPAERIEAETTPAALPLVRDLRAREMAVAAGRAETPPEHLDRVPGALAALAQLAAAQPEWAAGVAGVTILGEDDFVIETRALPFPVKVGREGVGPASRRLGELLPELTRRYGEAIEEADLRFSRRLVLKVPTHRGQALQDGRPGKVRTDG